MMAYTTSEKHVSMSEALAGMSEGKKTLKKGEILHTSLNFTPHVSIC
jgi:hypothetical protein